MTPDTGRRGRPDRRTSGPAPQRAYGNLERAPGRDFEPEPLIAILDSAGDTAVDQVNAGQVAMRIGYGQPGNPAPRRDLAQAIVD